MKDNPISARKRMKRWRRKNLERARASSAAWKQQHPDWYLGPSEVRLLTTALLRNNEHSIVWRRAGIGIDKWNDRAICLTEGGLGRLHDGHRLEPIKSWKECSCVYPIFLAPENFRLVKK